MTKANLVKAMENGEMILAGEYVGSVAETMTWRDKTSGKTMTAPTLRHTVLCGQKSILLRERCADTFLPETYVAPFKRMQRVAIKFKSLTLEKGATFSDGTLEILTD